MTLDLRYTAEAQETKEKVGKLDLIKTKKFLPFKRPSMIKKKKKKKTCQTLEINMCKSHIRLWNLYPEYIRNSYESIIDK